MNLQTIKLNVIEALIKSEDENLIRKVEALLKDAIKENTQVKPMTLEEFYARIKEAESAIEEGKVTSMEDLEKEAETW